MLELALLLVPIAVIALATLNLSEQRILGLAIGGVILLIAGILLAYRLFPPPGIATHGDLDAAKPIPSAAR